MFTALCSTARLSGALGPSLLSRVIPSSSASAGMWRAFASITASEARQGNVLMLEGRPIEVTEFRLIKSGRGAASVSLSYVDLDSLKTGAQTFSVHKKLEKIDAEKHLLRVMYVDGDKGNVVMADANFDEVQVPLRLFGGPAVADLLTPEMQMSVLFHEGEPIKVNLPSEILTLLSRLVRHQASWLEDTMSKTITNLYTL